MACFRVLVLGAVLAVSGAMSFVGGADRFLVISTSQGSVEAHWILPNTLGQQSLMHYIEHLTWLTAFGGEPHSADRQSNAWTNNYAAGYWLSGAPEDLTEMLETLSGVFDPIDLPREFAEQERDIILREYEYRITGNPDANASEAMDAFLYEGNPIAASVIGTPDEIMAFDYDEAMALHAATHRPENASLVVIGDVTKRQVRRALRRLDLLEPQGDPAEFAPPPFDLAEPGDTLLRYPDPDAAARMHWRKVVTFHAPKRFDLLEAQIALLRDILDTNLPGGLAGPLRFDAAVARSFKLGVWPIDERHIEISFTAAPDREVSLPELRAAFEATFAAVAAKGIPPETYFRVLKRFDGYWPAWDNDEETADWMASYVLDRVSVLREPLSERELKRLEGGLSHETANALLRQLSGEGRAAIAFIGPEEFFE